MAHKITGRNMFFLYMCIIHVSCCSFGVVWPGHACLDIGPPHVTVPPIPIVSHGTILRYRGTSYFVLLPMSPICISAEEVLKWHCSSCQKCTYCIFKLLLCFLNLKFQNV